MKTFWRLLTIIAPAWPAMLGASLLAFLTVAANVGLMTTSAYLIAAAALHPPLAALSTSIVGVRFFGLSRAVFRYLERYVAHDATFRLLSRIRVWCYQALEPLVPAGISEFRGGDLFSRLVSDVESLQYFYLRVLLPPAVALLTLAAMAVFLAEFAPDFAVLLATGFACAGILLPVGLALAGRKAGRNLPEARARLAVVYADMIRGMRDLSAAPPRAAIQAGQGESANSIFLSWQESGARLAGIADAAESLFMNLALVAVVLIAVPMIQSGALDGVFLAVVALGIQSSFEAVLPLGSAYRFWEESLAAAGRLFALLDAKPRIVDEGKLAVSVDAIDLEVRNLKFRYREQKPLVLDDISFSLPAGGRLAIVGPSGAGKSTLVSLLLRFWEYEAGSVRLGGREIRDYQTESLRNIFGVVQQQDYVFNATIGDNILLARPNADSALLAGAADRAALGGLLRALPQGLGTPAGEGGCRLSGGEVRRLSIARALLKDAPILVFDEPTAGLDAVTEREIMAEIEAITPGKTTILITHRLLGLEKMDEILVMDHGRVVERGSLDDLLTRKGLFYAMWRLQQDLFPAGGPEKE